MGLAELWLELRHFQASAESLLPLYLKFALVDSPLLTLIILVHYFLPVRIFIMCGTFSSTLLHLVCMLQGDLLPLPVTFQVSYPGGMMSRPWSPLPV